MRAIILTLLYCVILICDGYPDLPFFSDISPCCARVDETEYVPFYESNRPLRIFDKRSDSSLESSELVSSSENLRDPNSNNEDFLDLNAAPSAQATSKQNLTHRKRSVSSDENSSASVENQGYDMVPSTPSNQKNDIKEISLPGSLTSSLGKKRLDEKLFNTPANPQERRISNRARVINLSAGNAFTPRFGRSESSNRILLNAGNSFTPRLGRSEAGNRVLLNAGSAFTPRFGRSGDLSSFDKLPNGVDIHWLGKSDGLNRIQLNAGSAFTPRLGRSDGSNRILLNAGGAFTPRLGRSEGSNRILLNAGGAFTPRLGRSEGSNRILLNAGGAFTPRLGRSEGSNRILLNAGSAFTSRLGRSEDLNKIRLNAGSSFTPRFGRSEDRIRLNAGNAFTPRLGRSGDRKISLNAGGAFTPRFG